MTGILAVALSARAGYLLASGRLDAPPKWDERHYHTYAVNLLAGKGYTRDGTTPTSFWPPGYPAFLAGVYAVFGISPSAARIVQIAIDVLTVLPAFLLARRYFGERTALVAGGLCALYPYFIYRSGFLLAESAAMFLAVLTVYLATLARRNGRLPYWLAAGIAAGLLALTKAAFQIMPVIFLLWFLLAFRNRRRPVLKLAACIGVMLLTIAPYIVRNAIVQKRLVGVATEGGMTFYGSHNKLTFNDPEFKGFWINTERFGVENQAHGDVTEADLSARQYAEGWKAVRANAGKMPELLLHKFSNMWFIHFHYFRNDGLGGKLVRLSFVALLPFFLAGLLAKKRGAVKPVMPQLLLGMFTILALVFYGNSRMRAPVEPFILMFAAAGMAAMWRRVFAAKAVGAPGGKKLAYIISQFPQTYETFILREVEELTRRGVQLTIFSLRTCRDKIVHEDAVKYLGNTVYSPFLFSAGLIAANVFFIARHPLRYIRALFHVLLRCSANPVYMAKVLALFPKSAYFARCVQRRGLRHIHAHWASIPADAAMIVSILTGARFSITAHAYDIYTTNPSLVAKLRRAEFVVTCTAYNVAHLTSLLPPGQRTKIHLNYHGLALDGFPFGRHAPHKEPRILAVGRLTETKGYPYLIEAVHLLRLRGIECECDIVGDGELRRKLERQIRERGLEPLVKIHGVLNQPRLIEMMRGANALVMASVIARNNDRDGIPNVLLEAMALGLPVIATDVSGIPEVVIDGKTGTLVASGDAVEIEQAVAALLANPGDAARMAANARKKIERDFGVNENVGALMNLFETTIWRTEHAKKARAVHS